jgi:hypothetical protein
MEDGTELSVHSVESLSVRIREGDVLPDTPLYDASTDLWVRAAEAPVVHFILEELQSEGVDLSDEWSVSKDSPGGSREGLPESDLESLLAGLDESPRRRPASEDSFDLGITLAHTSRGEQSEERPPAPGSGVESRAPVDTGDEDAPAEAGGVQSPSGPHGDGEADGSAARDESGQRSHQESTPGPKTGDAWLTRSDAGELVRGPDRPVPDGWVPDPEASASDKDPGRESRGDGEQSGRPGRKGPVRHPAQSGDVGTPSTDLPPRRGRLVLRVTLVAGAAIAVALVLIGRAGDPATPPELEFPEAPAPQVQQTVPPPSAPEDLAPIVEDVVSDFRSRIQGVVDSLASEHGVGGAPPPQWLSGRYLSNAGAYPEARQFWERYADLVGDLRELDRTVFLEVVAEAEEGLHQVDRPDDAERLETYMEARYAAMAPGRNTRYEQLEEAARRAIALHDFLVAAEDDLRFTPAVGSAVPRDPVLEVGTDNAAVLAALNSHLDELFRALDRSRGGGALSQGGLRTDLFLGFGEF